MSETTDQPPVVSDPGGLPQPAVPDPPAPAPADTGNAPEGEAPEQREQPDPEGRRVAQVRARLAAAERREAEQLAELEFYRRQAAAIRPEDETPEQRTQRERAQIRGEVEQQIRTETFHQQGATQYADWKQRCDDLVAMGADPGFASLLVEMPGGEGVRVAAALAADPDAVQRIANLRTERARAVALGKYAATIEDAPQAASRAAVNGNGGAPAPVVTRAPAPIRPVTGRVSPVFNEYSATAAELADHYMRQNLERQQRR
jgi:hypothetical protein